MSTTVDDGRARTAPSIAARSRCGERGSALAERLNRSTFAGQFTTPHDTKNAY
jgi:hypothetical protein